MFLPVYVSFTNPCVFGQITKLFDPTVEYAKHFAAAFLAPAISSVSDSGLLSTKI